MNETLEKPKIEKYLDLFDVLEYVENKYNLEQDGFNISDYFTDQYIDSNELFFNIDLDWSIEKGEDPDWVKNYYKLIKSEFGNDFTGFKLSW